MLKFDLIKPNIWIKLNNLDNVESYHLNFDNMYLDIRKIFFKDNKITFKVSTYLYIAQLVNLYKNVDIYFKWCGDKYVDFLLQKN